MAWYQDSKTGAIVSQRNENAQSLGLFHGYTFEHFESPSARFIKNKWPYNKVKLENN